MKNGTFICPFGVLVDIIGLKCWQQSFKSGLAVDFRNAYHYTELSFVVIPSCPLDVVTYCATINKG